MNVITAGDFCVDIPTFTWWTVVGGLDLSGKPIGTWGTPVYGHFNGGKSFLASGTKGDLFVGYTPSVKILLENHCMGIAVRQSSPKTPNSIAASCVSRILRIRIKETWEIHAAFTCET